MKSNWLTEKPIEQGRPLWGFCRVKVGSICNLWSAYAANAIGIDAVRVWFALHELVSRRCGLHKSRTPCFTIDELVSVVGLARSRSVGALHQLEQCKLCKWSVIEIQFATTEDKDVAESPMLSAVANARRTIPIPRHTVLFLARARRPVLIATMLGYLIRGMYYRSGSCLSWGTCKTSWIASLFGVDARNVKKARQELMSVGWLKPHPSSHWHRQRFGGSFTILLDWDVRKLSPPPTRSNTVKSPPPESDRNLPTGINNQNRRRRDGLLSKKVRGVANDAFHIEPDDLTNVERKVTLFGCALAAGYVRGSSFERLRFFAAMSRARKLGTTNQGGFAATIVRRGLWHHISAVDEEDARRELRSLPDFYFGKDSVEHRPPSLAVKPLSSPEIRNLIADSLREADTRFPLDEPSSELPLPNSSRTEFPARWSEVKPEPSEKRLHVLME